MESLSQLVEGIADDDSNFKLLYGKFGPNAKYLKRKGIFPYDFLDSFEKLKESSLPGKEQFFNKLTNEPVSDSDYKYAIKMFKKFNCKTMLDYTMLYLTTDCYLLAIVFEQFRQLSLNYYGLDPLYFYSCPGLAFNAALKHTKIELELLTDYEMFNFLERGIRGGISVISQRYSKACNQYTSKKVFGPKDPQKYIFYIDSNNLYGGSLCGNIGYSGFKWVDEKDFYRFDPRTCEKIEGRGAIFEVSLLYPESLHDKHNCYPLCPEKRAVHFNELSPFQKQIVRTSSMHYNDKQTKLLAHFYPRENYIVHQDNLRFYLEQGIILTKIHRILTFLEKPWLSSFVKFNADRRQESLTTFHQKFFKMTNNAVFGRSCMNKRKRIELKLVKNQASARKFLRRPTFKFFNRITESLYTFALNPSSIILDTPIYIGFTVLELSKLIMFDFHYNKMKLFFPNTKLLASDTDSFIYEITTCGDLYAKLQKFKSEFDFSDYPSEGKPSIVALRSNDNKKVLLKYKDELCGKQATSFIGLSSKCYSLEIGNTSKATAKGVKTCIRKQFLNHDIYKDVLFSQKRVYSTALYIRNKLSCEEDQALCTIELKKNALSCFDSKRYIRSDGIKTYAFGHYRTKSNDVQEFW